MPPGSSLLPAPTRGLPFGQLLDALHFAAEAHRSQRRKGADVEDAKTIPYINHPIRVAWLMAEHGGIDDLCALQAAVLHDTIEDTGVTHAELSQRFGVRVADMVAEVTDDKSLPKAERKQQQIAHAAHLSVGASALKLADKIDNLTDLIVAPPPWPDERRRAYFDWASAVVGAIREPNPGLLAAFDRIAAQRP